METIIYHDLSALNKNIRALKLLENQMCIYISMRNDGSLGTHTLTFGGLRNEFENGYKFMNFAENSLTGEIFLVFTKDKGVELLSLKEGNAKISRIGTKKNKVIRFLCELLNLDTKKSLNVVFDLSDNLSKTTDNLTFKILQHESNN